MCVQHNITDENRKAQGESVFHQLHQFYEHCNTSFNLSTKEVKKGNKFYFEEYPLSPSDVSIISGS